MFRKEALLSLKTKNRLDGKTLSKTLHECATVAIEDHYSRKLFNRVSNGFGTLELRYAPWMSGERKRLRETAQSQFADLPKIFHVNEEMHSIVDPSVLKSLDVSLDGLVSLTQEEFVDLLSSKLKLKYTVQREKYEYTLDMKIHMHAGKNIRIEDSLEFIEHDFSSTDAHATLE